MARDAADLARKLNAAARATETSARAGVTQASLAAKDLMVDYAQRAGMRPGGRVAGRKWSVGFDVKGSRNPTSLVGFRGPVHLVNNPTAAHFIGARRLGSRAALRQLSTGVGAVAAFGGSNRGTFGRFRGGRGKRALTIGSNVRAYAFHPGTKGKRFFQKSLPAIQTATPAAYGRAWRKSLVNSGLGRN